MRITWQKIGKYAMMICLIIEGYGAWKLEKLKAYRPLHCEDNFVFTHITMGHK